MWVSRLGSCWRSRSVDAGSKSSQLVVKGLLWKNRRTHSVHCQSIKRRCPLATIIKIGNFLRVTALWVMLLPIVLNVAGALSNQVVLYVNHGKFPVSVNQYRAAKSADVNGMFDEEHCVMTSQTHLNLLADVFDWHKDIESIGDLSIDLGGWLWTFAPFVWGYEVSRRLLSK